MSVHTPISHPGMYFVTFTCYNWLHLIDLTNTYDEIYKFFSVLKNNGYLIVGYVIMPNHIQLLQYYNGGKQSLNTVIGNGKRFIGYEVIKRLESKNCFSLLNLLADGVSPAERFGRNKKHQVWQGTFDVKYCVSENFIKQKLTYIHQNPCAKHWKLAADIYSYPHSSAAFYGRGQFFHPFLTDYRDILEDDKYIL